MQLQRWIVTLALAVLAAAGVGAFSDAGARAVFLSGAPPPPGLTFASFGRAAVNAGGSTAFFAGWDGVHRRREGLYLRRNGEVVPIARAGEPIPGEGGAGEAPERFSFPPEFADEFNAFSLNDRDEVAFIVRQGLFRYAGGEIRPVVRPGEALPDVLGERWEEVYAVSINNDGVVALAAATRTGTGGERNEGVFLLDGGDLEIPLFVGDLIPGLDGELTRLRQVSLNEQGELAALVLFGEEERTAVLFWAGGEAHVVAAEGGAAPGGVWTELAGAALNQDGAIAFQGRVAGSSGERSGIYVAAADQVTPVALPGQRVEGGDGGTLGDDFGRPALDDEGNVAFLAELAGAAPRQALVRAAEGRLTLLALEGAAVPGSAAGTITRLSGLHLESMGLDGVVSGVKMASGPVSDSLIRFSAAGAPAVLLTTAEPLPSGSVLTLADREAGIETVQAHVGPRGDVVFAGDAGGYGRALFQAPGVPVEPGATRDVHLLTPLGREEVGGAIRGVGPTALNEAGDLVYVGFRDEDGSNAAIFRGHLDTDGTPAVVAATGQVVPGVPDRRIAGFGGVGIDGRGDAVFVAYGETPLQTIAGETGHSTAAPSDTGESSPTLHAYLARAAGDHLELLAGEGQMVEGAGRLTAYAPYAGAGGVPGTFRELQVNRAGQALFLSSYVEARSGAFVSSGLFLYADGAVRAVALPGQTAPLPGDPVYFNFSAPRLSDSGAISFIATVVGGRRAPRTGLFRIAAGAAAPVAMTGDPTPELDGARLRTLASPAMNAAGDLAFYALLDRSTPPPANPGSFTRTGALVLASRGTLRVVASDGIPGEAGAALRLDDTPAAPLALREDGTLLIAARLRGSTAPDGLFLLPTRD